MDNKTNVPYFVHEGILAKDDATHTRQIKLKLNLETDSDILAKLDSVGNKQGYIKELIRADLKKRE